MELEILQHITPSMWLMFALGVIVVISYSWMTENEKEGLSKYFQLTLKNVVFHIFSSLVILLLLEEIGSVIIENFIPALNGNGLYHGTLSTLSGMFGSLLAAWIIEWGRSKFPKKP